MTLLSSLTLAARAIKGRPARLHQAANGPAAGLGRAKGVLAVIDTEACLEITELAARLDMVTQGRAAILDGPREHLFDGIDQFIGPFALNGVGGASGGDAGQEQRLAGIYIADTDQGLLVEQSRLDGRPASRQPRR